MPGTYILYSEKIDGYYFDACTDMQRRLYEHNIGHSKFTKKGMPLTIVHFEEFDTLLQAKHRELQIKKMKSRKYVKALISSQ